jgi:hypothetical protein
LRLLEFSEGIGVEVEVEEIEVAEEFGETGGVKVSTHVQGLVDMSRT